MRVNARAATKVQAANRAKRRTELQYVQIGDALLCRRSFKGRAYFSHIVRRHSGASISPRRIEGT